MRNFELSGLPLEYELMYGRACRYLDVADLVNNAPVFGVGSVSGTGFKKEIGDFALIRERSPFRDYLADPLVVTFHAVKPLP